MVGAVLALAEAMILETDGIVVVTMVLVAIVFIAMILIAIVVIAMGYRACGTLITLDKTIADGRTGDRTVIHITTSFIFFTFTTLRQVVMLFARTHELRLLLLTRRVLLAAIEIESLPMAFEAIVVFILSSHDCYLVQTRAIALLKRTFGVSTDHRRSWRGDEGRVIQSETEKSNECQHHRPPQHFDIHPP